MSSLPRSARANNDSGTAANVADPFEEAVTVIHSIIEGVKKTNDENKWQECVGNFNYSSMIRLLNQQSSHFRRACSFVKTEENFKLNDNVVQSLEDLASGLSKLREFLRPFVPLIGEKRSRDTYSNELHPYNEGRKIYSNLGCLTPIGKGISIYSNDVPEDEFEIIDKLANGFLFFHVRPDWKDSVEDQTISVSKKGIEIIVKIKRAGELVQDQSQPPSFFDRCKTLSEDFEKINNEMKKQLNNITKKIDIVD
ncbi:hypothetical protein TNCT_662551 [Trichonephila clavata]|uniref:Uncharacterized protein n=1 Tax=Trichonephila clavata TaxID=2740835 RepID=A0A8X6GSN4_TRICU|nr:hypothetical protein TNCT_662551 [Trichonephila clavata]